MRVLYLAMSPDGQTIVTGAGDETLRFWNVFPPTRGTDGAMRPLQPSMRGLLLLTPFLSLPKQPSRLVDWVLRLGACRYAEATLGLSSKAHVFVPLHTRRLLSFLYSSLFIFLSTGKKGK